MFIKSMSQAPLSNQQDRKQKIITAFFIGFLIGIVLYSIFNNTFGFLMLIPLYIIYRLVGKKKN
jgi:membrane protein insertase Oxa1/YidC/SpoIIIJ